MHSLLPRGVASATEGGSSMTSAESPVSVYEAALAEKVDAWRVAHALCVHHLKRCIDCGIELCPDGAALWIVADDAEARLPWTFEP